MKILLHRLIHNAVMPQQPTHTPQSKETVVGLHSPLFNDELSLHHLAAKASGIPAVNLLKEPAALKMGNLLLPIERDMTIERGFGGREKTEINTFGRDIHIDRPGQYQDLRYRVWGGRLDIEASNHQRLLSAYHSGDAVEVRSAGKEVRAYQSGNTVSIDKLGTSNDVSITRGRAHMALDFWDSRRNIDISFSEDNIEIKKWNQNTTIIEKDNRIEIDRDGWDKDLTITQRSGEIKVDARGFDNDLEVEYSAHKIELDKRGFDDDVTVTLRGNTVEIDRWGMDNDLEIELHNGYLKLDRFGMDQDVTIKGTAGHFNIQEGGMNISVTPNGLKLLSVQVDSEFDVAI